MARRSELRRAGAADRIPDYIQAVWTAVERRDAMVRRIEELVPDWSLSNFVYALRCFRGLDMISAATLTANIGDISRFDRPRHLMSYLGLTPSEYSSGGHVRRGGITKAGNREARRMIIEAAWSYRFPAKVAQHKARVLETQPKYVRDLAWKAQERLCRRYRSLQARGKKSTVVTAAIARELAGFVWALGQEMQPSSS